MVAATFAGTRCRVASETTTSTTKASCTLHAACWLGTLTAQPAAWSVPLAFVVMVVVSLATRQRVPANVAATMLRLHAPEALYP